MGDLEKAILARLRLGHWITLKKGVPKKKSPTGKAIPAIKERVPGCTKKAIATKGWMRKHSADDPAKLDATLLAMRQAGTIVCTNGIWWQR